MRDKAYNLIVFGGTGDLSTRKLFPALFLLFLRNYLPHNFKIYAIGSRKSSAKEYNSFIKSYLEKDTFFDEKVFNSFFKQVQYLSYDLSGNTQLPIDLGKKQNIFYLALPPDLHKLALAKIGNRKKSKDQVVIEKPFGFNEKSAIELNKQVLAVFREEQIFRIDHYLAKETVQNIFAFRFSNGLFEPIWNNTFVDSVYIEALESIGIEGRSRYFDKVGIIKDMVQSHLLQLLSIIAMDHPKVFDADTVRNEKVKIFKAIDLDINKRESRVIRAQYKSYRSAKGIAKDSAAPTFAALKLWINNKRWQGVPFFIRTGKKMPKKLAQIVINFKEPKVNLFGDQQKSCGLRNQIKIVIQPNEEIRIRFGAKKPGGEMVLQPVDMVFKYKDEFESSVLPAYAKLLCNVFKNDQTIFARSDGVEASWKVIDKYEEIWAKEKKEIIIYKTLQDINVAGLFTGVCKEAW